jgi:Rps23 Pro-64 3,4-dihydroxylase Tpa1-like proline 4-hydroxylase
MLNSLDDYIVVLEGVVTPQLCDAILKEYANCDDWLDTVIGNEGAVDKTIRNCSTIGISFSNVIANNQHVRATLDKYMHVSVGEIIRKYRQKFPECSIEQDSGYDLLRYKEGEFYSQHTDSFKARPRAVSCSVALNDDYEGGEWAFFNREKVIKVPKGAAVLFPSNFMYPHEIMPVTKGIRYSIVTWFI